MCVSKRKRALSLRENQHFRVAYQSPPGRHFQSIFGKPCYSALNTVVVAAFRGPRFGCSVKAC